MTVGPHKQPDWQRLYEAAMLELDQSVLPSRVHAARVAIQTRIVELHASQSCEENSRLEDALTMLDRLLKIYS